MKHRRKIVGLYGQVELKPQVSRRTAFGAYKSCENGFYRPRLEQTKMRHSLILVVAVLLFASIANAQTEKEKRDFVEACLAGVIKTGCPTPNTLL
jgi:hypothetical protein